jgi:hypothetical protein
MLLRECLTLCDEKNKLLHCIASAEHLSIFYIASVCDQICEHTDFGAFLRWMCIE